MSSLAEDFRGAEPIARFLVLAELGLAHQRREAHFEADDIAQYAVDVWCSRPNSTGMSVGLTSAMSSNACPPT
jgi:hypothetical protein